MAIDMKDFPEQVDTGLKANKSFTKFFYRFKKEGITKRGLVDYTNKDWDKRTRISKVKTFVSSLKDKEINIELEFNENSSLDSLAKTYFSTAVKESKWNDELFSMYKLYVSDFIGKKKVKDIKTIHIDGLLRKMETSGKTEQTKNGCSPRTIRKVIVQALKPILEYAYKNDVLEKLPEFPTIKQNRKKKKVENAGDKLANLYNTINKLYEEDSFYRALFLFALYGRRWNEIRTLKWNDIDFENTTYTIRAENNKIQEEQTYDLPLPIFNALKEIHNSHSELIFVSPVTGKELHPPKKQLAKIKELAKIPELTMHYFRHILVSAMGEIGTANTILSASLGHTNLNTVNDFYLSANHTKASQITNKTIAGITNV